MGCISREGCFSGFILAVVAAGLLYFIAVIMSGSLCVFVVKARSSEMCE